MIIESLFPPVPPLPPTNASNILLGRPDQAAWEEHTAYIDAPTGNRLSWLEVKANVRDSTTALATPASEGGLGLSSVDMVGVLAPNCLEYPVVIHALLATTVPCALFSATSTKFELEHALRLSKATHVFVHPTCLALLLPVAKVVGLSTKKIYIVGGRAKGFVSLTDAITRMKTLKRAPVDVKPAGKDTLAYIVFSSGTTGLPKAVMITHGNIIFSILQAIIVVQTISAVYQTPPPATPSGLPMTLAFLPMHHSFGLHAYIFRACLQPGTVLLMDKWDVVTALKLISKYRVSSLPLVPSAIHQLLHHPLTSKSDLSSLTGMSSGAAYLTPELGKKLQTRVPSANVVQGYGMSEGTIAALAQPFPGMLGGLQPVYGATGILIPGMKGRLVRDDGTDADYDEVGELWLSGGNISPGYWDNPKATKDTFVDGWLKTGDKFSVDKAGNFFFADRAKDTLKVSGAQVSPLEIENVLLQHPDQLITDVSVAGVTGGRTSDEKIPRAWVVLSPAGKKLGSDKVIKSLEAWHQESLSKYKWLRGGIEVVREIPKSSTGKVLRRVLVDKYELKAKKAKAKL